MAKVLEMPKLSPTMTEGQLTVWHKKEGESVAVDDLLAEVETDKATMEFRSFDKGTLLKHLVPAGSQVLLSQPVAILGNPGDDISSLIPKDEGQKAAPAAAPEQAVAQAQAPAAKSPAPAPSPQASAPRAAAPPPTRAATAAAATGTVEQDGRVRASPYVRKIAREREIDLNAVPGSGPRGRVVARDLESVRAPAPSTAPAGASLPDEMRPLSMMRKTIARRLTESKQTVPHFYLSIDVDAAAIAKLREQINADLAASVPKNGAATEGGGPFKISINDLLIKACSLGLLRVPECNASFTAEALVIHRRIDISVAVAIPDGLVTPVIRRADKKSVVAIAQEMRDLAARAKAKKLRPEEMTDGTFSISNLGMFGIDSFAAVINPPEGAILAVGRVRDEPVVSGGEVVPGQRLALTLSCDHRVVDGAVGAKFLAELRTLIERPTQMLVF